MGTTLAVLEPLKLPSRPDRMPSLPAWVASRLELLSEVHQNDGSGKHRTMTTLPPDMMLAPSEKNAIAVYAGELGKMLEHTPEKTAAAEAETLVHITKLMLSLPGMRSSETGAEAPGKHIRQLWMTCRRGQSPQQFRRWYRGDAMQIGKTPHDYRWRPAPAILRALAFAEACTVKGRVIQLERLISAVPRVEYSDEHRGHMLERLSSELHLVFDRRKPEAAA
jgi:hypothetical protein